MLVPSREEEVTRVSPRLLVATAAPFRLKVALKHPTFLFSCLSSSEVITSLSETRSSASPSRQLACLTKSRSRDSRCFGQLWLGYDVRCAFAA